MDFQPGDIFKLKDSVTDDDLRSICLSDTTIDWIREQENFQISKEERHSKRLKNDSRIYWYCSFRDNYCYFKKEFCELVHRKSRGHPMTRMFEFEKK